MNNICKNCVNSEICEHQSNDKTHCSSFVDGSTDASRFKEITEQMLETFIAKNHDYGNAFEKACDEPELGFTSAITRMYDKMQRLITLHKRFEIAKVNESIEDTLLDLANYCIMSVIWLRKHKI